MKVGSLFSGIGGFDLGLERAGMEVIWQVENDPYCQKVLANHWPDVPRYGDIKEINWNEVERPDLICGGFPCQPVSLAGKRLVQADERWLWPEFARAIRILRPRFVLVENVPGLLSAGISDVLGDLAASGYDAEWDCIPAAAVGAPHLRYRVLLVAYTHNTGLARPCLGEAGHSDAHAPHGYHADSGGRHGRPGRQGRPKHSGQGIREHAYADVADAEVFGVGAGLCPDGPRGERWRRSGDGSSTGDISDTDRERCEERRRTLPTAPQQSSAQCGGETAANTHTSLCDGRSDESWRGAERRTALGWDSWWATEPDVGRVAHGVPARVDRLRGLGNAVVPQVAEWIGRRIMAVAS